MCFGALLAVGVSGSGCGGTLHERLGEGAADYDAAKGAYDRGDFMDAIPDFKSYIEQYPGTDRTDDALYLLGDCYLHQKDYALASGQFDRLLRDFPTSPLQPDALFALARCDDLQSHGAQLDQTETKRALTRFTQFMDQYPDHARAPEARARVKILRDRLAEKTFRTGRLYSKIRQEGAATMALRQVLTEYPESRWAVDSELLLAEVLARTGKREEAVEILERLLASGLQGEPKRRALDHLKALQGDSPR